MGQTWTDNSYDITHIVNTDMTNVETNLITLKSMFSGTTSPAAVVAGQIYFNTSKNIPHFLNAAESDFLALLTGDTSTKIWQYRNTATPGWVIDSSVTDKVLALKGGSDAYNRTGGGNAGSWTITGINADNHALTVAEMPAHTHTITGKNGNYYSDTGVITVGATPSNPARSTTSSITGSGNSHNHTATHTPGWRPTAAVGTLQYPDVTQA